MTRLAPFLTAGQFAVTNPPPAPKGSGGNRNVSHQPYRCKSCGADATGAEECAFCGSATHLWVKDKQPKASWS